LKHSINKGSELRANGSERANNKAKNEAQQLVKKQRHATASAKGMARAADGIYKKGNK
jgi:wobble nucleotide-excising tRNase